MTDRAANTEVVFAEALRGLVHHLFPNGSPNLTPDTLLNNCDAIDRIRRPPNSRATVASTEGLRSIKRLQTLAKDGGFTSDQQHAIILAACATLGSCSVSSNVLEQGNFSEQGSNSGLFRDLVRCILPRPGHPISAFCVLKLLSVCQNDTKHLDSLGIISVLQFLTLAVRNGALGEQAARALSSMYPVIMSWVLEPVLCFDSVRLLLAITKRKHARIYRARRIHQQILSLDSEPEQLSPLVVLLQLFTQLDPSGCGKVFASAIKKPKGCRLKRLARWFSLPDLMWKTSFYRIWHKDDVEKTTETTAFINHKMRPQTNAKGFHCNDTPEHQQFSSDALDRVSDLASHMPFVETNASTSSDASGKVSSLQAVSKPKVCIFFMLKQDWYQVSSPRTSSDPSTTRSTYALENDSEQLLEGITGSKKGVVEGKLFCRGIGRINGDEDVISRHRTHSATLTSVPVRENALLVLKKARQRILAILTSGSIQADHSQEAESAFLHDILPSWDGTEEWGVPLCYDTLPILTVPNTFSDLWCKALISLEKVVLNGTPKMQYAIISGALASLLNQLARHCATDVLSEIDQTSGKRDTSADRTNHFTRQTKSAALASRRLIKEFVHWAHHLLLQSSLSGSSWDSGLLSEAALTFFQVVGHEVTRSCSLLVLPGACWVHRFLLSSSPFATDRGWQLMTEYRSSFKVLKARHEQRGGASSIPIADGLDRVALFNCLVWDFCLIISIGQKSSLSTNQGLHDTRVSNMSILFQDIPETTLVKLGGQNRLQKNVPAVLSISEGAAFAQYLAAFLHRKIAPKHRTCFGAGVPSLADLVKGALKQEYFDCLQQEFGMDGLQTFLSQFVVSRSRRPKSQ